MSPTSGPSSPPAASRGAEPGGHVGVVAAGVHHAGLDPDRAMARTFG